MSARLLRNLRCDWPSALNSKLTPWSRVLHEKQTVPQLVKKFPEKQTFSISQEIPRNLWQWNVQYRVHIFPSVVVSLKQKNPICASSCSSCKNLYVSAVQDRDSLPGWAVRGSNLSRSEWPRGIGRRSAGIVDMGVLAVCCKYRQKAECRTFNTKTQVRMKYRVQKNTKKEIPL